MDKLLSTYDISQICQVRMQTVINWTDKERILKSSRTPGGHRRIRKQDFDVFVKKYNVPCIRKNPVSVLVADDNEHVIELTEAEIKYTQPEWKVLKARDGLEAMFIMGRDRPDAVILDIIMPQMTGVDVCRKLKAGIFGYTPLIIAITGKVLKDEEKKYLEDNTDAFLKKPFDFPEIIRILRYLILDQSRAS